MQPRYMQGKNPSFGTFVSMRKVYGAGTILSFDLATRCFASIKYLDNHLAGLSLIRYRLDHQLSHRKKRLAAGSLAGRPMTQQSQSPSLH